MAEQIHVYPQADSQAHVVSLLEACWCSPQVLQEDATHSTHIHKPILPVVEGHSLALTKSTLYA